MSSDFANFRQKHAVKNLKQNSYTDGLPRLVFLRATHYVLARRRYGNFVGPFVCVSQPGT